MLPDLIAFDREIAKESFAEYVKMAWPMLEFFKSIADDAHGYFAP